MNNKIVSYISFALRNGSAIFGMDDIIKSRKKFGVILFKEEINPKNLNKIKAALNVPMVMATEELNHFEKLAGAKVILITDKNLSEAIINNAK